MGELSRAATDSCGHIRASAIIISVRLPPISRRGNPAIIASPFSAAVATVGKLGGSAHAARITGMDGRTSWQLGALMNTRGLMELIALNVGYDMGILSQRIFTVLVLMVLVTTIMTGPLLTLSASARQKRQRRPSQFS